MSQTLRAGVIGAGVFGGYHAAQWSRLPGAQLAAVLDVDADRAAALADKHGITAFVAQTPPERSLGRPTPEIEAFLETVDVVSITAPAAAHGPWALTALKAGKPLYVEKPLAATPREADAILAAAARQSLVVACGFLERAALIACGLGRPQDRLLAFEAVRRAKASPRNLDVSVALDLMIHDLDLALWLGGGAPFAVEAEGRCIFSDQPDEMTAEVTFDDGLVARFSASRAADAPERTLRLTFASGVVEIDLLAGVARGPRQLNLDPRFGETPMGKDRLAASLAAFTGAVRGEGAPLADAADGARALDLALAVEHALGC